MAYAHGDIAAQTIARDMVTVSHRDVCLGDHLADDAELSGHLHVEEVMHRARVEEDMQPPVLHQDLKEHRVLAVYACHRMEGDHRCLRVCWHHWSRGVVVDVVRDLEVEEAGTAVPAGVLLVAVIAQAQLCYFTISTGVRRLNGTVEVVGGTPDGGGRVAAEGDAPVRRRVGGRG